LCSRGEFGVKLATLPEPSYVTLPVIVVVEALVTLAKRNDASLIVDAFMASLNVHVTAVVTAISIAPLEGEVDTIDGIVVSGFSATCLLLHDKIAKVDRRNTSDIMDRFFIIQPLQRLNLLRIYRITFKQDFRMLKVGASK
jgi:hypothetical protein